ncbi:MAG TPA: cytochrome b/b6 domain-containing protein [Caulobacteraceae bacterium]|jgi:thiosulfate reductase cytochrome b subunit
MSDTTIRPDAIAEAPPAKSGREVIFRHSLVVRVTHWINVICISLLLMSGLQIFNAHPMLYWGQYGADADKPVIEMVADNWRSPQPQGLTRIGGLTFHTTGVLGVSGGEVRGFPAWATLPGHRNLAVGRNWHFFLAWIFVINGGLYLLYNAANGHLRKDLTPTREQLKPSHIWRDIVDHLRLKHPVGEEAKSYNVLQKFAYLAVVFILLPMMVATGLTMSPGFDAFAPWLLDLFGGRQSARTLHFICANLIVLFVIVHVVEVFIAGVFNEIGSMITGRYTIKTRAH